MPASDRPPVPAADELLRHAQWMRALARSLVLDDATADDVTQDAWRVALERPPRAMAALRGWLAAVIRSLVAKRARGEARRRLREIAVAPHEAVAATDDVVDRAEIHRRLVDAVLELDEPYRSTLLLRFFDGLPPRAIAERKGLPDATVRSHLKRGLDRMRERFDAEHGGDRGAWVALMQPLAFMKPATLTLPGLPGLSKGILMGAKAKVAIAVALVVVAGAALLVLPKGERRSESTVAAKPSEATAATASAATTSDAGAATPSVSASPLPPTRSSASPIHFVYGAFVDGHGTPLEKGDLSLWRAASNEPGSPTSDRPWREMVKAGVFAVSGLTPGHWSLRCTAPKFRTAEREFDVGVDTEGIRVDLRMPRSNAIAVRLRTPDGQRLLDQCPDHPTPGKPHSCSLVHLSVAALTTPPPDRFPAIDPATLSATGVGRFLPKRDLPIPCFEEPPPLPKDADGAVVTDVDAPLWLVLHLQDVVLASAYVSDLTSEVTLVADPKALAAALTTLRVHVVDPDGGTPLPHVQLFLGDQQGWWRGEAFSDEKGIATFQDVPPGLQMLEHWGFDREQFKRWVRIDPGIPAVVDPLPLSKTLEVAGRVVDDAERPQRAIVRFVDLERSLPHALYDEVLTLETEADGSFRPKTPTLGRSRYLLLVDVPDQVRTAIAVDTRSGHLDPIEVRVARATPITFRFTPPQSPAVYEITNAQGLVVFKSGGLGKERLVPGKYVAAKFRDQKCLASVPFEVGSQPLTVDAPGEAEEASARGRPYDSPPADSPSSTPPPALDPDPVGAVSFGTIADASGAPIDSGSLTAFVLDGHERDATIRGGGYAVAGLACRDVEWYVGASDQRRFVGWSGLEPSATPQRRDLALALDRVAEARRRNDHSSPIPWDACTLRLRLADAVTGHALEPSLLATFPGEYGGGPDRPVKSPNGDGSFVLKSAPATGELVIRVPTYGQSRVRIDVPRGSDVDLGTISLAPTVKVRGRVVDESNEPLRTRVTAEAVDVALPRGMTLTTFVFSDANGEFEVEVGRGRHRLVVREHDFVPVSKLVDAPSDDSPPVELELVRGVPAAVRVDEKLDPETVVIESADGGTVLRRPWYPLALRTRLAPGDYVAVALRGNERVGERRFTVGGAPQLVTVP